TTSDPTKVTINVKCVKDAPRAREDKLATAEDTEIHLPAPGLLQNDFIDDGVKAKATVVDAPEFGQITAWGEDGSFTYLPNKDYNGTDSFSYSVTDTSPPEPTTTSSSTSSSTTTTTLILLNRGGRIEILPGNAGGPPRTAATSGGSAQQLSSAPAPAPGSTATVIITVGSAEDAPLVANDAFYTGEDEMLTVPATEGPLVNDADPDFGTLTAAMETPPSEGKLTSFSPDGSFTYQPKTDFNGRDLFTYTVTNQTGKSATGRIDILVGPQDDKVLATGDKYQVQEDTPLTIGPPGLLGNDIDPDGGKLTIALVTGPTKGTLELHGDGSFVYAPAEDQNGVDKFTYKINDPDGNQATADVIVLIRAAGELDDSDPFTKAGPVTQPPPPPAADVNPGPVTLKPPPPPPPPPLPPSLEGGGAAGGGPGGSGASNKAAAPPPPPVILTTEPAGNHRGFPTAPVAAGAGGVGLLAALGGLLSRRRSRLQPLENLPL
ncbi:MAG TPA: Ig-like domain-containing protein, partial [Acidimicrobiia bacterium]|nr:Ig-like domain-containing protein [Acidimicrobiia bacterium]